MFWFMLTPGELRIGPEQLGPRDRGRRPGRSWAAAGRTGSDTASALRKLIGRLVAERRRAEVLPRYRVEIPADLHPGASIAHVGHFDQVVLRQLALHGKLPALHVGRGECPRRSS